MVHGVDAILQTYRTQAAAERAAYDAAIRQPPQLIWRWTKFILRGLFYLILPVLYLCLRQQGEGR